MFKTIRELKINAYDVLVRAKKIKIEDVEADVKEEVKQKINSKKVK